MKKWRFYSDPAYHSWHKMALHKHITDFRSILYSHLMRGILFQLSRAGIAYQIINNDADREIFIRILQLPDVENVNPKVVCKLRKLLIACTIRLSESMFLWDVEYKFSKSPFKRY